MGDHDNGSFLEEDFGQKIDLTVRIREILQNYASGISILKEVPQMILFGVLAGRAFFMPVCVSCVRV